MLNNKEKIIKRIEDIVNKCINAGLKNELKKYTIPYLRNYMLLINPTADSRINPWKFLINEIKESDSISLELQDFIDDFIREANQCYKNHIKTESKQKIEEVSRNDLLAKSKLQTKTRYEKSSGYKGFSIVDIDTTSVFTTNCLRVTCSVGDYYDTVEVEHILYWIQAEAENEPNNQINTKSVTRAIMDAIDGMNIKVDCSCPDFYYRFSYMATKLGYKYGKPQDIPAPIRNPNDYGAMCKHLISMLSNKKWLQQVTGTLMDFLIKRIDDVNKFLKVKPGEELTLPNELARQNAKKGFYSKLFKDDEPQEEEEVIEDNTEIEEPEELIDVDIEEEENNE